MTNFTLSHNKVLEIGSFDILQVNTDDKQCPFAILITLGKTKGLLVTHSVHSDVFLSTKLLYTFATSIVPEVKSLLKGSTSYL